MKKIIALTAFIVVLVLSACSDDIYERQFEGLTFAEARSGFTTSLTRNNTNDFAIPTPPQGVFDLVHFTSPVGSLAAYVSSDPGDGQQHPLIIWVVGGWSNGISEFPWSYGDWDNDQSAAAFREAGILMMYPSFRGANGNPGYFESLFGEIDDIVAAFEFAAALPYVDSSRIYLGGHSTGGTRVLLASAYTDVFRAVFSFGPVDDIAEHNQTQFTFNLREAAERELRSPIHWLDDISSPTFIIEGAGGNADAIRNMDRATTNANVHPFVVPGGDHFDILAPITRLAAQKILDDTGDTVNISITLQELQSAMEQPPISSMPVMVSHTNTDAGVSFLLPFIWELDVRGEWSFSYTSPFFDDNFWESSHLFVETFELDDFFVLDELAEEFGFNQDGYQGHMDMINNQLAFIWEGISEFEDGERFFNKAVAFQVEGQLTLFDFWVPEIYREPAGYLFEQVIGSVVIG